MLVEIDSLQHPERGCFKTNKAIAEFFQLSPSRVSEVISSLSKKGFIKVVQVPRKDKTVERQIFISTPFEKPEGPSESRSTPSENAVDPLRDPESPPSGNAEESNTGFRGSVMRGSVEGMGDSDEPPAAPPKKKKQNRKQGHPLPNDFKPNDTNKRIAEELCVDLASAVEQFCDHHAAKGSLFKDWHLALNTWIRNEAKFSNRSGGGRSQPRQHGFDQFHGQGLQQRQGGGYSL